MSRPKFNYSYNCINVNGLNTVIKNRRHHIGLKGEKKTQLDAVGKACTLNIIAQGAAN